MKPALRKQLRDWLKLGLATAIETRGAGAV